MSDSANSTNNTTVIASDVAILTRKVAKLERELKDLTDRLTASNKTLKGLIDVLAEQVTKTVVDTTTLKLQSMHSEEDEYKHYVMTQVLDQPTIIPEGVDTKEQILLSVMRGYDDDQDDGSND